MVKIRFLQTDVESLDYLATIGEWTPRIHHDDGIQVPKKTLHTEAGYSRRNLTISESSWARIRLIVLTLDVKADMGEY